MIDTCLCGQPPGRDRFMSLGDQEPLGRIQQRVSCIVFRRTTNTFD
ncbi:MAG: hypothetical protein ACXVY5_08765 [Gaiellales bacterium]